MSTNRKSTMIAVALLSAAVTFLICYGQIRSAQKRAAVLQKQIDAASADRDWAFFRGQNSTLTELARVNSMEIGMNVLQKSMLATLQAGRGPSRLSLEAMRHLHKQIAAIIPGEWTQFELLPGRALIDGTEYDLPPKYETITGQYGPFFTLKQKDHNKVILHTLTLPNGKIVWDGVNYGPVPVKGRVQLGAGGSVLINGVLRKPQ